MKKFSQMVVESDDFTHYKKHATAYIRHANRAAKMMDEPHKHSEDAADEEQERANHHFGEVRKRHGDAVADHMGENVTSKHDVHNSWKSRPK